jgi:hypothetical protein
MLHFLNQQHDLPGKASVARAGRGFFAFSESVDEWYLG